MTPKEKIRMIQADEMFLSLKGTCIFNMRVGVIGHMIVGVMHVCKHVVLLLSITPIFAEQAEVALHGSAVKRQWKPRMALSK